jgi:hypothetical protein
MAFAFLRRLDGRVEKRLPISIVVHLTQIRNQSADEAELTYTDNISAHGACVISHRSWKLGDMMEVTSLKDRTALRGKVIHCQKRSDEHYAIGLAFQGPRVTWSNYRRYLGT